MDFLDENIQQGIKKGLKSMTHILYNEMYIYVWFICIYHVILVIIVLTNLVLLVKVSTRTSQIPFHSLSNLLIPSSYNSYNNPHTYSHNSVSNLETLNLNELEKMVSGFV